MTREVFTYYFDNASGGYYCFLLKKFVGYCGTWGELKELRDNL